MTPDTRHAWAERFEKMYREIHSFEDPIYGRENRKLCEQYKAFIEKQLAAAEQRVWQAAEAIVREKMRELSNTPLNERLDTWAWLITTRNAIATRLDSQKPNYHE